MKIEENVLLSGLTTFKTGGPARFLITLEADEEVVDAYAFAKAEGLPVIPLGGGSNMLAHDDLHNAVFVRSAVATIESEIVGGGVRVSASAGVVWDALVLYTVQNNWWGLENLSHIPGTVGGAVVQNIGAYGAAIGSVLESVVAYDSDIQEIVMLSRDDCMLGYRTSIFKKFPDRFFVLSVRLVLSVTPSPVIAYKDLVEHFNDEPNPSLDAIRNAVITIRGRKFPPLAEYGTAGSFFLNPVMNADDALRVRAEYPNMPLFDLPEGGVKVPLAWFLEHVVKVKGMQDGAVSVWKNHSLVLVSESGATTADVIALAENISKLVKEKIGIDISIEVRVL